MWEALVQSLGWEDPLEKEIEHNRYKMTAEGPQDLRENRTESSLGFLNTSHIPWTEICKIIQPATASQYIYIFKKRLDS